MADSQGTFDYPIPDPLKNAIELAQNRLSLLGMEEERLKRFKVSLDGDITALAGIKAEKEAENVRLDEVLGSKRITIAVLEKQASDLTIKNAKAKEQYDGLMADLVIVQGNLDGMKGGLEAQTKTLAVQKAEIVLNESAIAVQQGKINKFLEATHNLI